MGVDPRGPGVAGTGERADHTLAVQGGAQPLVAHMALDDVGDRRVEQHVAAPPASSANRSSSSARSGASPSHTSPRGPSRKPIADAREERVVREEAVDVAGRDRRDRARRLLLVVPLKERGAVFERCPLGRVDGEGAVAAARKIELADHERVQQTRRGTRTGSSRSAGRRTGARACTRHRAGRVAPARAPGGPPARDTPRR